MATVLADKAAIDSIQAALATLTTDTSKSLTDIAAKIASLQSTTPDPATATELGNILTSVQSLDSQIKAADPIQVIVNPGPTPVP